MTSASQIAANQRNAQMSSGPTSETGKSKVSLNAVKTALTGRTVLLPSDDAAAYETHILAYQSEFNPVGALESDLVQCIADTCWRLSRIPGFEMSIYATGHIEFAESFNNHDPSQRRALIELETHLKYEKQLRNLQLQEARLHRRREKDLAELRMLQQARKAKEIQALDAAARQYVLAKRDNQAFDPKANGFEFSIAEIERYLATNSPSWLTRMTTKSDQVRSQAA